MPTTSRHYYEIIREGLPCHLYFDLEFDAAVNRNVDGAECTRCLLSLVADALQNQFQASFRDTDVVQLDSTTDGSSPHKRIIPIIPIAVCLHGLGATPRRCGMGVPARAAGCAEALASRDTSSDNTWYLRLFSRFLDFRKALNAKTEAGNLLQLFHRKYVK